LNIWLEKLQKQPYLLLVLATLFWGSNFVFGRVIVQTVPPFHLSVTRWVIGFFFFFPFAWQEWKLHRGLMLKHWKTLFWLALSGVAGFNSLLYVAVQYTSSINASLVNATAPLLIVILSVLFLREKLVKLQYLGIIVSFIGVIWVFTKGEFQNILSLTFNKGDLFVILAVISWSIYSILMKKKGVALPKKATFLSTIALGIFILQPFLLWEEYIGRSFAFEEYTTVNWLGIVYLGIFPSVISFVCWNEGVMQIGPGKSSNFLHFIALFAGILAIIVGEMYTLTQFVGGILILTGVIFASNPQYLNQLLKRKATRIILKDK
jgi:drug/metabolite transporter (DMT)-like permease